MSETTPQNTAINRARDGRIVFDIETAPLEHRIELFKPEFPPFDPTTVKYGNLKDEFLRKQKLDDALLAHRKKEKEAYKKHVDKAALSPELAQVLAIGIRDEAGVTTILDSDTHDNGEAGVLEAFWKLLDARLTNQTECVGFNIKKFDLPFLARRSFQLQVGIPPFVYDRTSRRWHSKIVDLMEVYGHGEWNYFISLDKLAKALEVGRKKCVYITCTGKTFHEFWRGTESRRAEAVDYLSLDLKLTKDIAERLLG